MSEEFASQLVEMQLALNDGLMTEEAKRTPDATTPTTIDEFLKSALER